MSGELAQDGNAPQAPMSFAVPLGPAVADATPHLLRAAVEALAATGEPVNLASGAEGTPTVLTDLRNREDREALAVLVSGVTLALAARAPGDIEATVARARLLASSTTASPDLYRAVEEFFRGRWSTDDQLIRQLFRAGATYDRARFETNLDADRLLRLASDLDVDIHWQTRQRLRNTSASRVLALYPALDYRLLDEPEFRDSTAGRRLERACASLLGDLDADREAANDIVVTVDGGELPPPPIPLQRHPIVEALLVEHCLSLPSERLFLARIPTRLLRSDSPAAHAAVLARVSEPISGRTYDDRTREVQFKVETVRIMIELYRASGPDPRRSGQLVEDIVSAINAFTGNGAVAVSLRERNRTNSFNPGADLLRNCLREVLAAALAARDPRLVAVAQTCLTAAVARDASPPDLNGVDAQVIVLDAVARAQQGTSATAIDEASRVAFGDWAPAAQLRDLALQGAEINRLYHSRSVMAAWKRWRELPDSSSQKREASRAYDQALVDAHRLSYQWDAGRSRVALALLRACIDDAQFAVRGSHSHLLAFEAVRRVDVPRPEDGTLPTEYSELMALAADPHQLPDVRNAILRHIAAEWHHVSQDRSSALAPVIRDMCRAVLGSVGEKLSIAPDDDTGVSAALSLLDGNKHALDGPDGAVVIAELERYADAVRSISLTAEQRRTQQIAAEAAESGPADWVRYVGAQFVRMERIYGDRIPFDGVAGTTHAYVARTIADLRQYAAALHSDPDPDSRRWLQDFRDGFTGAVDAIPPTDTDQQLRAVAGILGNCYDTWIERSHIGDAALVWKVGLPLFYRAMRGMDPETLDLVIEATAGSAFGDFLERRRDLAEWTVQSAVISPATDQHEII